MSEAIVKQVIEDHLLGFWGTTTAIAWDDIEFSPVIGQAFIAPMFECVQSQNIAIGCERDHYLLQVAVSTPSGDAGVNNAAYCDTIKNNFINRNVSGVSFKTGRIVKKGSAKEWYTRAVLIECFYDNKF